jgi:signal transduction histidine kinase
LPADSLRRRLVLAGLLLVVVTTVAAGWALSLSFRQTVERGLDQQLVTLLLALVGTVEPEPDGTLSLSRPLGDPRFDRVFSGFYWVVADRDSVLLRSRSLWDLDLAPDRLPASSQARLRTMAGPREESLRVAEQTVTLPGARRPLTFMVTADRAELAADIRRFDGSLALGLGALGLGLLAAVVVQVGLGLRPLRRVAAQVEAVRTGHAGQLEPTGLRELDPLVNEVNQLISDNRRMLDRSRASAADLAHALKTPLAVLRTSLHSHPELAAQASGPLGDMQRIIDRQLARAAAAGPRSGVATPVAPVAAAILDSLGRIHADRHLALEQHIPDHLRFPGDSQDLEEILGNLLDNACKWATTRVRVSATVPTVGGLLLQVEDDGPGIAPEQAAAATARGGRLDTSVPGSGLGLAIVTDLVDLYGGRLELGRSSLGGLLATVELPANRPR